MSGAFHTTAAGESEAAVNAIAAGLTARLTAAEDLHAMVFKPHIFDGPRAERDAVAWLERMGFSVGRMQARSPRGLMFGSWDVQKWRNLNPAHRAALHGQMMAGAVTSIHFAHTMPAEAVNAVKAGIIERIAAATAEACALPEGLALGEEAA